MYITYLYSTSGGSRTTNDGVSTEKNNDRSRYNEISGGAEVPEASLDPPLLYKYVTDVIKSSTLSVLYCVMKLTKIF